MISFSHLSFCNSSLGWCFCLSWPSIQFSWNYSWFQIWTQLNPWICGTKSWLILHQSCHNWRHLCFVYFVILLVFVQVFWLSILWFALNSYHWLKHHGRLKSSAFCACVSVSCSKGTLNHIFCILLFLILMCKQVHYE